MFDNSVLNVVISLVFIFLIYSLLATALREAMASVFQSRADTLFKGIKGMLTNTEIETKAIVRLWDYVKRRLSFIWSWVKSWFVDPTKGNKLYERFYQHPIILNYGENSMFRKPCYLTAQNFSTILVDTIKNLDSENQAKTADFKMIYETVVHHSKITDPKLVAALAAVYPDRGKVEKPPIDEDTFRILNFHLNEAAGDLEVFKARIEQWFDDTMARVSSWYKRQTQLWLFLIGFGLAMALNINAIQIATTLSANKAMAQKVAEMGIVASKDTSYRTDSMVTTQLLQKVNAQSDSLNLLVGYRKPFPAGTSNLQKAASVLNSTFRSGWTNFFGIFITAIAISLGAPFWFDLLNKVVNIRGAVGTVRSSGNTTKDNKASKEDN